jgi:hypothetical protein
MIAITLVAVAAAIAAWLRPMPKPSQRLRLRRRLVRSKLPTPSQRCAPPTRKFTAQLMSMHRETAVTTRRLNSLWPRILRQIYVVDSAYLLSELADKLATPSDLAAATGKVARLFQVLTIDRSVSDPSVEAYDDVNATGHNHPKPL